MTQTTELAGGRVLVTGAFGFVGGHLVRQLLRAGAEVSALDLDTRAERPSQINRADAMRGRIHVCDGDVMDEVFLQRLFQERRFQYVFHLAASASVIERAARRPAETLAVNSLGVVRVLEAAREDPDLVCFLHASTDKVYGDQDDIPYDEVRSPLQGAGIYEASKIAADIYARAYATGFGLPTVVVRLCNLFGPFDIGGIDFRLVPRALRAIFANPGTPPQIYAGSEDHRRDYLYVEDCCTALLQLATTGQPPGSVFNLPGCENLSTIEMGRAVIAAAARAAARSGDTESERRINDNGYTIVAAPDAQVMPIRSQRCSGTRIENAIGFRPRIGLTDGLDATAAFYDEFFRAPPTRNHGS